MNRTIITIVALVLASASVADEFTTDFGADLRIREEMMDNVPGLPDGGVLMPRERRNFTNHIRFRSRFWGDFQAVDANEVKWQFYVRLADEFRWCPEPHVHTHTFPDEIIPDNVYLSAIGLFDGFLDFKIGRQDLYGYCGLDHVFVDGTPGDGSRTTYTDMASFKLHCTEISTIDLFALYNFDDSDVRWGTERSRHTSSTGLGGGAETEMDDWGLGLIWGSELDDWLPYQLFIMQKNTHEFERKGVEHPWTQRELVGGKLMPQLDEEWSLQFEAMGQIGENDDGDTLSGWSSYAGVNWKSSTASSVKPFGKFGYHFMSGDEDAADEDGGHRAWDPMWARGVNDSEMFLYGTHYGAAWWSNQHYVKLTAGIDLGRGHRLAANTGPLFAAAKDGMGGGNGMFKGLLSQVKYEFPIWLADREQGERFEVFGHLLAEFFNPGDYYESDRPAFFVRWQLDFKF